MQDIRKQLSRDLARGDWEDLLPHAKRDAVIVIETALNLLDVATAIATDDKVLVEAWIDSNNSLPSHLPSAWRLGINIRKHNLP